MLMTNIVIATFYHFTKFTDLKSLCEHLTHKLDMCGLKGTVLLASEGINGTLAGSQESIDSGLEVLRNLPNSKMISHRESNADSMPFFRLKIRVKNEIVTMKVSDINPPEQAGTYVSPKDWNKLIIDPETVVIDARNSFEVEMGTFQRALNPQTNTFSELPKWIDRNFEKLKNANIAMFCTGGIRCEKATSYLKLKGINNAFHLKGGILNYLDSVDKTQSLWNGECFVFDYRVSVIHKLKVGEHKLCHACRHPVSPTKQLSSNFVPGISCDYCIDKQSNRQRARYLSRQRQIELAKKRGEQHVGKTYMK